jgi:alpha-beta hydrolase superfamily lysophospholipase
MVTVRTANGSDLLGFLWTPAEAATDTALIYVHGIGALPLRPIPIAAAGAFAARGIATLTIELRRTGRGGQALGVPEEDVEDIDAFVEDLVARGYRRIITCGHSLGSISITLHQALRHNPAVVANVHLAPTAEGPDWARRGMGPERYDAAVERARAAVAEGRGDELLMDDEYRLPDPDPYHRPGRHFQRARSWLAWWGPETINQHTKRIAEVDVPIYLLSGTDDNYNDPARHDELVAAATRAPSVGQKFYPGGNHGFEGLEYTVAQDIAGWLTEVGVLT